MKLKVGKTIKHSPFIDKNTVMADFSSCGEFRYQLEFQYSEIAKGDTICVILMNPSAANLDFADNTVRRVQDCIRLYFKKAKKVIVVNLFARRGMNPKDINDLYQKEGRNSVIGHKNDEYIKNAIDLSKHVICAWGGPCGIDQVLHDERVDKVQKILSGTMGRCNVFRVYGGKYDAEATYPLHGRIWGKDYKLHLIPNYNVEDWAA